MTSAKRYSVTLHDNFVHLKTWGKLDIETLDAPAAAALEMAEKHNVKYLLDDISGIETANVSIAMQTRGMAILWRLRKFEKVAILFASREVGLLFFNSLQAAHLGKIYRGFDKEAEAIAWLKNND